MCDTAANSALHYAKNASTVSIVDDSLFLLTTELYVRSVTTAGLKYHFTLDYL